MGFRADTKDSKMRLVWTKMDWEPQLEAESVYWVELGGVLVSHIVPWAFFQKGWYILFGKSNTNIKDNALK